MTTQEIKALFRFLRDHFRLHHANCNAEIFLESACDCGKQKVDLLLRRAETELDDIDRSIEELTTERDALLDQNHELGMQIPENEKQ